MKWPLAKFVAGNTFYLILLTGTRIRRQIKTLLLLNAVNGRLLVS